MTRPTSATAQPAIVLNHVSKWFNKRSTRSFKETFINWVKREPVRSQQFQALKDVSFSIAEGESVAVMGLNGSGKSTTLKMVSGVMQPDGGEVLTRGRVAGLIEVGAGFHPDLTGRENVFLNAAILGMSEKETKDRFDEIVEFSGIGEFIDQEVKHYSSGMFMRLAFSVAIHVELDVLLVDEVLSVGDAPFRAKCNAKLKEMAQEGITMMIVSHSAGQVKELCTRGIVIRKGEVIFDGAIDAALEVLEQK
ncbi:ABC transporter ATP-binding protein [Microbacterium kribbense]|uniref:ABC transporter ATP-binding protein n=1 Tax=Microbacterium kribbense TaxID=433645 RepID=A0ABP7GRA2_9MICO